MFYLNYRTLNSLLILLIVFIIWYLIFFNFIDLGFGDKAHRALFAYDSITSTWAKSLNYFLYAPWPPVPYIVQVYFHKLLILLFNFENANFIKSLLYSSLFVTFLHLLIISEYSFKMKKGWVGTIYIIGFCSFGTLLNFQISSMAESYTLFFLSLSLLFLNLKKKIIKILLISFCFFLATLCRTEIIVFSIFISIFFLFFKNYLLSIIFSTISLSPFYIKSFINFLNNNNMSSSYLTIVNQYDHGNLLDRIKLLQENIDNLALAPQNIISIIIFLVLTPLLFNQIKKKNNESIFLLITCCGFLYFISIILLILIGFVPADFRYLIIPIMTTFFGIIFITSSQTLKVFNFFGKQKNFLLIFLFFIGSFFSIKYIKDLTPIEIKDGKQKLVETINSEILKNKNYSIVVDHIQFWDMYFMTSSIIEANLVRSATVYDLRPSPLIDKNFFIKKEDEYKVKINKYVDQFNPALLVTSTNKNFNILSRKKNLENDLNKSLNSIDPKEKYSYFFNSTEQKEKNNLELNVLNLNKSVSLSKIFQNENIIIYKLTYNK